MKSIVLALLLLPIFILPINAQELRLENDPETEMLIEADQPTETTSTQDLEVDLIQNTQNPANRNVTFELVIDSKVNSDRVRIVWDVRGVSAVINKDQEEVILTVRDGQRYVLPFTIRPTGVGGTEVSATARVVGAGSAQVASVRKNFASNAYGDVVEIVDNTVRIPSDYRQAQTVYYLTRFSLYTVGGIVGIVGLFIGFKKFVRWYKKDEIEAYEKSTKVPRY